MPHVHPSELKFAFTFHVVKCHRSKVKIKCKIHKVKQTKENEIIATVSISTTVPGFSSNAAYTLSPALHLTLLCVTYLFSRTIEDCFVQCVHVSACSVAHNDRKVFQTQSTPKS